MEKKFYWTLIVPERMSGDSKQELVRYWFADNSGLPLVGHVDEQPETQKYLPGTAVWHFGYSRGGWIKPIAGPEQTNPWGRLGRLFFSYPLPFYIRGQYARTDSPAGQRLLKGAFFRLLESETVEYRSEQKSQSLILGNSGFGEFHVFVFVLKDMSKVRDYVDPSHPVIGTLNGQNHGEMTRTILAKAGLPELATSTIIEIRLDDLDLEAQSNIIENSRESFKRTDFTRELEARLVSMLEADEVLKELELSRQEKKAREASVDMSKRLSAFLSSILSDARGRPGSAPGSGAPGKSRHARSRLPEVIAADPPTILRFLYDSPVRVPEGTTKLARFCSDGRPPKYSFHGDSPRLFAELRPEGRFRDRIAITGRADINQKGYGSISVSCVLKTDDPVLAETPVGELHLTLQSVSGKTLHASVTLLVEPKPPIESRQRERDVKVEITFSCPNPEQTDELAMIFAEDRIAPMGPELIRLSEELEIEPAYAAYCGDRTDRHGESFLRVEINAGNPTLRSLMSTCKTAEEKTAAKERYCRDVVLDCYQHQFEVATIPEEVTLAVSTHSSEEIRTAEIYLNHDKAVRFAIVERERATR